MTHSRSEWGWSVLSSRPVRVSVTAPVRGFIRHSPTLSPVGSAGVGAESCRDLRRRQDFITEYVGDAQFSEGRRHLGGAGGGADVEDRYLCRHERVGDLLEPPAKSQRGQGDVARRQCHGVSLRVVGMWTLSNRGSDAVLLRPSVKARRYPLPGRRSAAQSTTICGCVWGPACPMLASMSDVEPLN